MELAQVFAATALLFGTVSASPCPPRCSCSEFVVDCHAAGFESADALLSLRSNMYPKLDTLIVTGSRLGSLKATNLFGKGERHTTLSKIALTNTEITTISETTLRGAGNLEELDLSNNMLSAVHGDLFKSQSRLRVINLTNSFNGDSLSPNRTVELIHKIFRRSDNTFSELTELILDNNDLTTLRIDTFCSLPALQILSLTNNDLTTFDFLDGCFSSLRTLDLAGNNIRSIPPALAGHWKQAVESMSVQTIDLSDNPFVCDCHLSDFVRWVWNQRDLFADNKEATVCVQASPAKFRSKPLLEVDANALSCATSDRAHHTVLVLTSLLLISGAILAAYFLVYRRKNFLARLFGRCRGSKNYSIVTYSKLTSEEMDIAPEFV